MISDTISVQNITLQPTSYPISYPMYIVICASLSSIPAMFGGSYVLNKLTAIVDNVALDHTR